MKREAISGLVASAVALSLGELVTAVSATGPSLIGAVGDAFIDQWGAQLKDLAVAVFGTNHKLALSIAMVLVALGLGALLGHLGRRNRWVPRLGFVMAAALGLWAYLIHPLGRWGLGLLAVAVAAGSGLIMLRWLMGIAAPDLEPAEVTAAQMPGAGSADRRKFLQISGSALGGAAAIALLGLQVRGREFVSEASRIWRIPRARQRVIVPSGASAPVEGITSYITPTEDFFRIDTALRIPRVNADTWKLRITGMVDQPFEINFEELLSMDSVEEPITLQCVSNEVGGDLVGTAVWQGVRLTDLLERARLQEGATQVIGESVDAFTAGFPTELLADGRSALVAYAMNGELLPIRHGFPARLVVSGLYGYVSATKWLREIRLTTWEAEDGYWMPRGWSKQGPVKMASRIDLPRRGDRLETGSTIVAGIALAPSIGISAVEVQVDDGPWERANLAEVASEHTWVQWWWPWDAAPGEHRLQVRAIDGNGKVQTSEVASPAPNGASGWHQRRVRVS
jgi:DMSO/TMAO reductase YedYZ molybdopterin-dependent catalytic subunit